ncbi:MAG: ERCC4 domain-containing protein, partial [Candidatus Methanoperedens sp.]|nr:ERCC4 domain-containing protein [Candidatus Methanoperedens sp.]
MVKTMKNLDIDLDVPEDKTDEPQSDGQTKLMDFSAPQVPNSNSEVHKVKIYVDKREIRSHVAHSLENMGAEVILRTLEVGDYVVSDRVGIERKTTEDFLSTFLDGRDLFGQISDLARAYRRPLLIIEGEGLY